MKHKSVAFKLKKGFSIMEITAIVIIMGIMFIALSSFLNSRGTISDVTKNEFRLNQINKFITGYAQLKQLIPAHAYFTDAKNTKPFINNPPEGIIVPGTGNSLLFKEAIGFTDAYGKDYSYYPSYGVITIIDADRTQKTNICTESSTSLKLIIKNPTGVDTEINDVLYLVTSAGKDGIPKITVTKYITKPPPYELDHAEIITIDRSVEDAFDDQFRYVTLKQMQDIVRCPQTYEYNTFNITTKYLANRDNRTDTKLAETAPDIITRDIIYTNASESSWCVLAENDIAKQQINAFMIDGDTDIQRANDTTKLYDMSDEIQLGGSDNCSYQGPRHALWITLNKNDNLTTGTYNYRVFARSPSGAVDYQSYTLSVPDNGTTPP